MNDDIRSAVADGRAVLGIELGSTRVKAVIAAGPSFAPVASGDCTWENGLEDGLWTYPLSDVDSCVRAAVAALLADCRAKCGAAPRSFACIGVSAMMHGYLAFDEDGSLLVPFRTWRNVNTAAAAAELSKTLDFNIPLRWSVAHLGQAVLDREEHVRRIASVTTLAGYVHRRLTGRRVLGVGDASGMFPIGADGADYDAARLAKADAWFAAHGFARPLRALLPEVLPAGADAGSLTPEGAAWLDPSGTLAAGSPLCPPEGDAGTGMVATSSVRERTGNISAGTSVFAMAVLDAPLSKVHPEIDVVTTPTGRPVAMVHCNNCTSELNAWAETLGGFARAIGAKAEPGDVYRALFEGALRAAGGEPTAVSVPFVSGEPVCAVEEGRPFFVRRPGVPLAFDEFARALVAGALSALKAGMDVLARENVRIDAWTGHGGYFKTPVAGARLLAAALRAPVAVMKTAGEGGPWGMALLAAYRAYGAADGTLEDFLERRVFADAEKRVERPVEAEAAAFDSLLAATLGCLDAERSLSKIWQ